MRLLLIGFLFSLGLVPSQAQDSTVVLSTRMFRSPQKINLPALTGWVYKQGHQPDWAKPDISTAGWQPFKPADLTAKDANQSGRVEGWFRLRFRLDSTFTDVPLGLSSGAWAAADVYLDGRLVVSFGSTGANGQPYREHFPYHQQPVSVHIEPKQEHVLALHVVDRISPFWHFPGPKLLSELYVGMHRILMLTGPQYPFVVQDNANEYAIYITLWTFILAFMALFFWVLSTQNLYEKKTIRLLALQATFFAFGNLFRFSILVDSSFTVYILAFYLVGLGIWLTTTYTILFLRAIYGYRVHRNWVIGLTLLALVGNVLDGYIGNDIVISGANLVMQFVSVYLLVFSWKRLKGAQWAVVVGNTIAVVFSALFAVFTLGQIPFNFYLLFTIITLCVPLSFSVYVALRFKEILAEVRTKAATIVQVTQEKNDILATQNERLEQQVEARTAELKASQAQLIQKEKLASLGELTAGIDHEIQNPLNFVNNFSEVSAELVNELREEESRTERDIDLIDDILTDLSSNLQKIQHHGGRASSIVKGMLEHSRTESGERRSTNLNALADEYLKIAYHGLRAKNKNFNCQLITDFAPDLGRIEVAPQEIGRVLLNLYNNAFYAVSERQKQAQANYQPTVSVSTKRLADAIEVCVSDNGTGIPDTVKAKIFQPFFTTKPTGEGTGLGLSLSYDIITKGHGGSLRVESEVGMGTTLIITLPLIGSP